MPSASVPPPSAAELLTAESNKDPDVWLKIISWALVVFSAAQVLVFSFGRDQGIYAAVAEGILQGELPYQDRWDFKPPGIFLVYASSFLVFGKSMMAPRIVEVLMLIGAVLGLRRLGGVFFGSRTAGILGGAVYALVHAQMDFWHTGQPESFAGPLTVYALVLATHDWSRHRKVLGWMGSGFLFGCAALLKPPFGGGALVVAFYLSMLRRADGRSWASALTPFLWLGFSSLVPVALCCGWFVHSGAWDSLQWTLFDFAPGYTKLSWHDRDPAAMFYHSLVEAFFGLSSFLALGTIAAAAIHPRAEREREGLLLLLGVLAFQLVGVTIQAKFFQYHFGASVPLIALMAGSGYYKLWRRLGPGTVSTSIAWGAFFVVAANLSLPVNDTPKGFWTRSQLRMQYLLSAGRSLSREELDDKIHYVAGYNLNAAREAAFEVKRHLKPGEPLYIWGFEPVIYSLSETTPSSRYIYNVPQRAQWQSKRALSRLYADLRATPPAAVLTQKLDVMPFVTGTRLDSVDSLDKFPRINHWLTQNYQKVQVIDRFTLWLPRSDSITPP